MRQLTEGSASWTTIETPSVIPPPVEIDTRARGADPRRWLPRVAGVARPIDCRRCSAVRRLVCWASRHRTGRLRAFTVYGARSQPRPLLFISGALSVVLGVFAFRDFGLTGAARVAADPMESESDSSSNVLLHPCWRSACRNCPIAGWYIFVGVLTVIAGMVVLVWPISSIMALAIIAGRMARRHGGPPKIVWGP